ncbi:neuropeptide SIFamide [Calliopsis andreniformis]|uniref:neuropeptide SIFamide n=1 Tax=Calliopsis andreniformis TaxID=337506 RepID=UPI003FCDEA7D
MVSTRIALAIIAVFFILAISSSAAYKRPPISGTIFGKRSNAITDYELTSRAMSSVCESVTETCNAWFTRQDSN